jgi:hypothetical protein
VRGSVCLLLLVLLLVAAMVAAAGHAVLWLSPAEGTGLGVVIFAICGVGFGMGTSCAPALAVCGASQASEQPSGCVYVVDIPLNCE